MSDPAILALTITLALVVFMCGVVCGLAGGPVLSANILQSIYRRLGRIEENQKASAKVDGQIMTKIEALQAVVDEANATTNQMAVDTANIADDIARIKAQIADGATGEELDALLAQLEAHGATLKTQGDALKAVAAIVPETTE